MIIDNISNDQLEHLFDSLTPHAAVQLIQLIEQGRENGKDNPIFDNIMLHARSVLREAGMNIDRLPSVKRVLCEPFEELLVSGRQFEKYKGRINRSSIQPIWEWLQKSLLPDEMPKLAIMMEQALKSEDTKQINIFKKRMYRLVAAALLKAISSADQSDNDREKRLLGMQLGGDCVFEDAREIAAALSLADDITELKKELPQSVTELDGDVLNYCVTLYLKFLERAPDNPEIFLATLMSRLKYHGQILRLAKKILLKEDDASISTSDHRGGGELLLSDLEIAVQEIGEAVRQNEPANDILYRLKMFHKTAQGLTTEVRINMKGEWGRRLVESRKQIAELIEREISPVHGLIRKALLGRGSVLKSRLKPSAPEELDEESLFAAQRALKILIGSRFLGEQFTLGVKIHQYIKENKQYLDSITERNIAQIKSHSPEESQRAMQSLKASLSLIRIMSGEEMAELVWRRGQAAFAQIDHEAAAS